MSFKSTGVFATKEQLAQITDSYQLAFNTPIIATLPNGKVPEPKEDFRDMANRFAVESGLSENCYSVCPDTLEFFMIID